MTLHPFTPGRELPAELDSRTVGRDDLLAVLGERLTSAATSGNRPHTLLVGPPGSGKTHLLEVALHRARLIPDLQDRLAVARISEDAIGVARFIDLLSETGSALGVDAPQSRDPIAWEERLLDGIGDRVLVLVVENLDRVFDSIGDAGQRDLRSWVESSGRVLLLASTSRLSKSLRDRTKPWFGGLILTPLEDLNVDDCRELLSRLADRKQDSRLVDLVRSPAGLARVRALVQFFGGAPGTWTLVGEAATTRSLDALVPVVSEVLERLVPYHQQLLWTLPPNHRLLIHALAAGDAAALTPRDLADVTGLSHQTVTAALGVLQDGGWVRSLKIPGGDQRRTLYSLRDPLIRHHVQHRTNSPLLDGTVRLLRDWYDTSASPPSPEGAGSVPEELLSRALAGQASHSRVRASAVNATLEAHLLRSICGDPEAFLRLPVELQGPARAMAGDQGWRDLAVGRFQNLA